ncbi:MAG TPA: hypothetical protein VGL81_23605 [Polyangiaceae bacterium]|jgi:hypothetical protein
MQRTKPLAPLAALAALAVVTTAFSTTGCGGNAPPPQAPAIAKPAPAPPPAAAVDVSPVPEPAALVVSARFAKLSASLATVHGWTKLPMPQSEQITELLTSEAVGPIVDLDQPIDFAVAVTGSGAKMKDLTAISAGVKDPERVKAALGERYKLVPGDNGVLLVQGLGKPAAGNNDEDSDGRPDGEPSRTCELAPAFGEAPVRLVCGLTASALTELGPWLTRTATRGPSTGDLHVDVRMKPLQQTIVEQKRLIGMILGSVLGGRLGLSSLRDLAVAFGNDLADFAGDLDGASADVSLGDAGVQVAATMRFSGSTSTLTRIATGHPERSGPAPAAFWQLPGDADVAAFNRGIDEAQLARGRDLVLEAVGGALGESGVKDADRKAVVDGLAKLVSPAAMVYGSGVDAEAVRKALAAEKALTVQSEQSEKDEAKHRTIEAFLGWRVFEADEPSTRFTAGLKELAAAIDRPSVAVAYRAKLRDAVPPSLRALPVPRSAALPAGAQHYLLELHTLERKAPPPRAGKPGATPKKPLGPLKPLLVHLFVVPDGARTWLAVGGDEGVTASRLAATLGGPNATGGGDKLAAHAALAPLKDASVGAGGFFTARGLPEAAEQLPLLFEGATWVARETFEEAAQMPHQGLTPILFSSTAQASGATPTTVTRLTLPKDAIEDVVSAVLRHGGF